MSPKIKNEFRVYALILPSYKDLEGGPLNKQASKYSIKIFRLPFNLDITKCNNNFITLFSSTSRLFEMCNKILQY
jgi:hypothetical protein